MFLQNLRIALTGESYNTFFSSAFFLAFLLLSQNSFANTPIPSDILEKISTHKLYDTKQWRRLLHHKDGKSEIDDPSFFLSSNGKTDLEGELKATILKLINDKTDNKKSTLCYYPSRSNWILKQLPSLKPKIKTPKCTALKKEISTLNVKQVTLILASAHINSPASAFGHTFLRLDTSDDTVLASYSVNYAAITGETNGFVYAYQGLFGGYQGRYSIEPYSKRLETYSDLEQRDIWEYPLKLTPVETNRLILHVLELRNFYSDYFFLSENCSYNLLWLLEVAKNDVDLTNKFDLKAIPIDTLRAVSNANLIKKIVYRPSKRKKILTRTSEISHLPNAISFAKSNNYDLNKLKGLSKTHKAKVLELASHLLQLKYSNKEVDKKQYLKSFITLLSERSKLGDIPESIIERPVLPKKGHKSNKISLSYNNANDIGVQFKIAYHDIHDIESGFIPGSYINFFDTSVKVKNNKVKLDKLHLLDIRSYAIQDSIFKPISWQVSLGAERDIDDKLDPFFQVGAGMTIGNEKLFSYATLTPAFYSRKTRKLGISTNIGVIYSPSTSLKLGLQGKKEWFKDNNTLVEAEPFLTFKTSKNTALNVRYNYKMLNGKNTSNNETTLSYFWYF